MTSRHLKLNLPASGSNKRAAFVFTLLLPLIGCGQSEESTSRAKSYGTSPGGFRSSRQQAGGQDSAGSDPTQPYLFSLSDAQAITELVLPYEPASASDVTDPQDATENANREFIAGILDEMMALKPHAPGRDFTVVVSADTTPNASALNQSLVINKGIIEFAPSLSLAMVICHEVAHSTRNHGSLTETFIKEYESKNKAASDELDAATIALVASAWNKSTQIFTHTPEDYQRVKPIWDAFWSGLTVNLKKLESEADIVGGRICANSGFSTAEVEDGFNQLFDLFSGISSKEVKYGSYPVKEQDLGKFLQTIYSEDSHPTDQERRQQITRVKAVFIQVESKDIADKWKTHFTDETGAKLTLDSMPAMPTNHMQSLGEDIMARHTQSALNP